MMKKRVLAAILTVGLTLSPAFASYAEVTAIIDLSAYDSPEGSNSSDLNIYFDQYDPESNIIPIHQNISHMFGEEDKSSLVFINRNGETVIAANPNWDLVAGFRHGTALVKDKTTGAVSRIDTTGNVLGTIDIKGDDVRNIKILPAESQYSYYYIVGSGDKYKLPEDDFGIVFINSTGEQKKVNLKSQGFHKAEEFDKKGRAALSTGTYAGETTFFWVNGKEMYTNDTYELNQTAYLDINGNVVRGTVPDDIPDSLTSNSSILIGTEGDNRWFFDYVCDVYTIKHLETPNLHYEIYQNGVPTGVNLYSVMCADEHTIIGYEDVVTTNQAGGSYFMPGKLKMYHVY